MVVGVDEVGRGSWAGPVCVAAVILGEKKIDGLRDSKQLSSRERTELANLIKEHARYMRIGWASSIFVDKNGLTAAQRAAAFQALSDLWRVRDIEIILDGNHDYIGDRRVRTIIHGDQTEPAISAASIVAKVARDNFMAAIHNSFPAYGFNTNVGYGTKAHRLALAQYGACQIHRQSYSPIQLLST
ncbi:MAG TPA: ribonuclease HII [Candidatus Saccharimonadales bacterium]|nr:ribonuclease HII [Candidatus Saccharimonadales bacterium]